MDEPLNIEISKFQRPISESKSIATYQQGDHVVVQIWEGQTLQRHEMLTHEEYVYFRNDVSHYELPDYPAPKVRTRAGGTNANGNTLGRVVGQTANSEVAAELANPSPDIETESEEGWWAGAGPWVHGGLDALGFIPGLGAIPDAANAVVYTLEGDVPNAGASLISAIPFAGDAVKGGLLINKGVSKASKQAKLPTSPPGKARKDGGKSKGKGKCTLRPYSRKRECDVQGLTGHHVVPDRAFRLGKRRTGRRQIPGGLSESEGLVICVKGKHRTGQHGKIHDFYDPLEAAIGLKNNPKGTAKLHQLELIGAQAAAHVVGCNPLYLMVQLRNYHESKGLPSDFMVRADFSGNLARRAPAESFGKYGAGDF